MHTLQMSAYERYLIQLTCSVKVAGDNTEMAFIDCLVGDSVKLISIRDDYAH